MKELSQMPFAEFAEAVKPNGAVNRLPSIVKGVEVYSYSIYLNGPLAAQLPADVQEHQYKDVTLYALTEKLGLDSGNFRDNLRVGELVVTRSAWMSAVLEATLGNPGRLSDQITEDFRMLADGMTHPWIAGELEKQRALTFGLQPALDSAGRAVGGVVVDCAPGEISRGTVVSQSVDFTMQATPDGEVVTHENRRLGVVPAVGQDVTVAYYRGGGQVLDVGDGVRLSAPFIDNKTGDLAVKLMDADGVDKQVVLFNGVASFAKFVEAQGLDASLVAMAIAARETNPKAGATKELPKRELVSDVYVDEQSGCLAVDYREKGGEYSVLFGSAQDMEACAKEFGLGAENIKRGKALESEQRHGTDKVEHQSLTDLTADLATIGIAGYLHPTNRSYVGKIVGESALHVAQDIGRREVVIYAKCDLDKLPSKGDRLTVNYENGRGNVTEMVKGQDRWR